MLPEKKRQKSQEDKTLCLQRISLTNKYQSSGSSSCWKLSFKDEFLLKIGANFDIFLISFF